jgi:hypothetical protein
MSTLPLPSPRTQKVPAVVTTIGPNNGR